MKYVHGVAFWQRVYLNLANFECDGIAYTHIPPPPKKKKKSKRSQHATCKISNLYIKYTITFEQGWIMFIC